MPPATPPARKAPNAPGATKATRATPALSRSGYNALYRDLATLLAGAAGRARAALSRELAAAYWAIGRRIDRENLGRKAGYGSAVLSDLARDLDLEVRTLQSCLLFYRTYPSLPADTGLGWAHFRELLKLRDAGERQWYERLAAERSLTVRQLSAAIDSGRYADQTAPGTAKSSGPAAPTLRRPTQRRYNYKAAVQRVIDGDTLELMLDLGFSVYRLQKIRLAGLDTEPIETESGRRARDFVLERLSAADFVVVHTNTQDLHGRYVGHLFYALRRMEPDLVFEKGEYLNQQLLDQGLAVPM